MAKRNWDKELFKRFEHVASPSQLVDYLDCPRKWWFKRCVRIPEIADQKKYIFGNVLHDVVQRYLQADDSGRGPDGHPVEIYPEGWNAGLNPAETALVRVLFEKGVSEGLIRRLPGRKIEREYVREVVAGVCSIGALDCDSPEGVEDQKSTKSARYIATQKELAADPKMLSYAYEWVQDHADADRVKLRLNYFVKDPEAPAVKHVEVMVPTEKVLEFWEKTSIPAHAGMLQLKRANVSETDWRKVTGPQHKDTCKKYGGCPYAAICGGCKSPAALKAEISRINLRHQPKKPKGTLKMSIFAKKKVAATAATPAPTPVVETAPAAPPPAPSAANPTTNAPWAVENCGACKGKGINKQGNPCQACYHIRKRRGEPTVDDFETWHDQAGNLCWKPKAGGAVQAPAKPPAPPAAPASTPAQVAPPVAAQAAAAPAVEGKAPIVQPAKARRGRPPKVVQPQITEAPAPQTEQPTPEAQPSDNGLGAGGFRLFINSAPFNAPVIDLADVLAREGAEMATAYEVKSFYDLDAFKRRDLLAAAAGEIAKELEGRDVIAIGGGQDLKALVEALRPLAGAIIQGVF